MDLLWGILDVLFASDATLAADQVREDGPLPTLLGMVISLGFLALAVWLVFNGNASVWRQILAVIVGCTGFGIAGLILEARSRMKRRSNS